MTNLMHVIPPREAKIDAVAAKVAQAAGSGCGCDGVDRVGLERTRFFARQLVGPDDLTQDQTYFREKLRRHNRLLHGWGIVSGAGVKEGEEPCQVVVDRGYILGPWGDEIVIDREVTVDLCKEQPGGSAVDPCGAVDPWCADVRVSRRPDQTLYLAIRYAECETRPVQTVGCGCGCDDTDCEYSRIRDSYEIRVLTELPESYLPTKPAHSPILDLLGAVMCLGKGRACPECPTSPWVILADVTIDPAGAVTIDCGTHRRYVVSFTHYSFLCDSRKGGLGSLGSYGGLLKRSQKATLLDVQHVDAQGVDAEPAATVAARTPSGSWITVPGAFEVKRGDTINKLLQREGGRTLVDTSSGETVTLTELYAAAGADPKEKVGTVAEALAPLEGAILDVAGLRVVRSSIDELLDAHGRRRLDDAHAGSPMAADSLPAQELRHVESESTVAKAVAGKTIAEVAAQPREAFVSAATKGLEGSQLKAERKRAVDVWTAAGRLVKLSRTWGESVSRPA